MSGNRQFVDTNVLVYAYDVTAGDKHSRARALVNELWDTREGCLSVQVLQEFFVTTTRKIPRPLEAPAAAQIIDDLTGITLVSAGTLSPEIRDKVGSLKKKDAAHEVGKLLADKAKSKGIDQVVFDRNGFLYHGRIKSLAESCREHGLVF